MNVDGKHFRTIWVEEGDPTVVQIIDQRPLPHEFVIEDLTTVEEMAAAIQDMHVRRGRPDRAHWLWDVYRRPPRTA